MTAVTGRITGDTEYDVIYTPIMWRLNIRYRYENGDTAWTSPIFCRDSK